MKEDLICLREEMEIIKEDNHRKRVDNRLDKMKYFVLIFYLMFFLFSGLYGNEYDSDDIVICLECPYCNQEIRAGFWGWTCEYCHSYNPPAVSTCQTCRRTRGY